MTKEISHSLDYLDAVSEFIIFLSGNDLTLDEILRHMVLVVFAPINAEAITFRQLDNDNKAVRIATWGMPPDMVQAPGDTYDFNDSYPSNDTLRYRRITWISTLPEWGDEYPLLKDFPYTTGAKSFICFPIDKAGTPVAALGVFSRDVIVPNAEIALFLKAVGSVFSMQMFMHDSHGKNDSETLEKQVFSRVGTSETELTERQLVILRLISEDRTNLAISQLLGYSESTIRQETMKIFDKLNCTGRKEAAKIYREILAKPSDQ